MNPYRKNEEKVSYETPTIEQQVINLQLKVIELQEIVHSHPNILLQLKYNKLKSDLDKIQDKINKPNYYKYLFIIFMIFNILKFISR